MSWITLISGVWKYKKLVGLALVFVVVGLMAARMNYLHDKLAVTERERNQAVEVANKNAETAAAIAKERDDTVALLNAARAEDAKRSQLVEDILKEVSNAPAATCPASDRLNAAHRGLRSLVQPD